MEKHEDTGKPHNVEITRLDRSAAERHENLLVGFDVARVEMQVPHGHAGLVRRQRLSKGGSGGEARGEPECSNQLFHRCPSLCADKSPSACAA